MDHNSDGPTGRLYLDPDAIREAVLDLVLAQAPEVRQRLVDNIAELPGRVAMQHLAPWVAEVSVVLDPDLDEWVTVGILDLRPLVAPAGLN